MTRNDPDVGVALCFKSGDVVLYTQTRTATMRVEEIESCRDNTQGLIDMVREGMVSAGVVMRCKESRDLVNPPTLEDVKMVSWAGEVRMARGVLVYDRSETFARDGRVVRVLRTKPYGYEYSSSLLEVVEDRSVSYLLGPDELSDASAGPESLLKSMRRMVRTSRVKSPKTFSDKPTHRLVLGRVQRCLLGGVSSLELGPWGEPPVPSFRRLPVVWIDKESQVLLEKI